MRWEGKCALALLALCLFSSIDSARSSAQSTWDTPRGATRSLLYKTDHKYQTHDPIKLYGKSKHECCHRCCIARRPASEGDLLFLQLTKLGLLATPGTSQYIFKSSKSSNSTRGRMRGCHCLNARLVIKMIWLPTCDQIILLCSETYQYYTLPFCTPKEGKEYKPEGLGEVLEGDRLVNTPYSIKFKVDKENEDLCSRELTAKELTKLRVAVKKDYYFQVCSPPCQ